MKIVPFGGSGTPLPVASLPPVMHYFHRTARSVMCYFLLKVVLPLVIAVSFSASSAYSMCRNFGLVFMKNIAEDVTGEQTHDTEASRAISCT